MESRVRRAGLVRLGDCGPGALSGADLEYRQLQPDSHRAGHGIRPATQARPERHPPQRQTGRRRGRRQQGRQVVRARSRYGEKNLGDQRGARRGLRRIAVRACCRR